MLQFTGVRPGALLFTQQLVQSCLELLRGTDSRLACAPPTWRHRFFSRRRRDSLVRHTNVSDSFL